jgi:hypothetical protein
MKIISHRGNLRCREPERENHPEFIRKAYESGFEVEIDVWYESGKFILGHDQPQYEIDSSFLHGLPLWCHAKNLLAAERLMQEGLHYFWHHQDLMTLTSKGIPWCNLNVFVDGGITVELESPSHTTIQSCYSKILGICTDYPLNWKKWLL